MSEAFGTIAIDVGDKDRGAGVKESAAGGFADSARAASDERCESVQTKMGGHQLMIGRE